MISKKTFYASERKRLDKYLVERCLLSRSFIQRLIKGGYITVNEGKAKPGSLLRPGDKIEVCIPPPEPSDILPQPIPLKIIYEDEDLLVIDKPAGLTAHPAPGHRQDTLINALLALYPSLPGEMPRPGIIHRLDKDTSGLLIVAKNSRAYHFLSQQFKDRKIIKRYLVLVKGRVLPEEGIIEAPIARHPRRRQQMAVIWTGKEAITSYKVIKHIKDYSLLEVSPKTGRTHQIRVHLSSVGYPVVGDRVYGIKSPFFKRQFIHASYLKFLSPKGEEIELASPLPPDLEEGLKELVK